jgi:hypothetical protein
MVAVTALLALGPTNVPNLENVHTKARMPGVDCPNLTLRTSKVSGVDVQRGPSEVTEEVVNNNKFLYTSQNLKYSLPRRIIAYSINLIFYASLIHDSMLT